MLKIEAKYIHYMFTRCHMKLAIIGSRSIVVKNLETYLPQGTIHTVELFRKLGKRVTIIRM